jgi:hypothetical protein
VHQLTLLQQLNFPVWKVSTLTAAARRREQIPPFPSNARGRNRIYYGQPATGASQSAQVAAPVTANYSPKRSGNRYFNHTAAVSAVNAH